MRLFDGSYEEKFEGHDFRDNIPEEKLPPMDAELEECYIGDWRNVLDIHKEDDSEEDDESESESTRRAKGKEKSHLKKIPKFPIDWEANRSALFQALQLPESLGHRMFMAVCLRYMKMRPDLLRKKLRDAGVSRKIVSPLIDYLNDNFELFERVYTNAKQFQIVDKYLRFDYDKEKKLTGIVVPDRVKDFFDFRDWHEHTRHAREAPVGRKFNEYLDTTFQVHLAMLDDESSGKSPEEREAEFYALQERLWRLQIDKQCRSWTGEKWDEDASYAPLSEHWAEYLNWHNEQNDTWENYKWRETDRKFDYIPGKSHDLKSTLYRGIARHEGSLYVLMPCSNGHEIRYGDYEWDNYFLERSYHLDIEDLPAMRDRYMAELDTPHSLRKGSVTEWENDTLQVRLGIRRYARPNKKAIAKGLYYFDYASEVPGEEGGWRALYPQPDFYTHCVTPHLAEETMATDDPFRWALQGTQVAAGYVTAMGIGRDYPIGHFQHQFMAMAGIVCNSTPESLAEPREFKMTDEKRALLKVARENLEEAYCPETVWFILENSDVITVEVLADQEFLKLLGKILVCLGNGLVIDRLQDLYKSGCEKDLEPLEAMRFALKVVGDIFGSGGGKEPWWFKEDFDLYEVFDATRDKCTVIDNRLQIAYCEEGREIVSDVAEESGFAFTYAIELYKRAGYKLINVPGLDQVKTFRFLCEAAKKYGIGNVDRACNIVDFAISHVMEVPASQRSASLELFEESAILQAPRSQVLGAMEGGETTLAMPGCSALMLTCIGVERMRELKVDDDVVTPSLLKETVVPLALPLPERARLIPGMLRRGLLQDQQHKLLAASVDAGTLMLPMPKADGKSPETSGFGNPLETPSNSIFAFFRQVREECGYVNEEVVHTYMGLYATKFPNPFSPPKGFLSFLQKFKGIPNPERLQALNDRLFAHPFHGVGQRREASERAARANVDRDLIISNLLDAQIMGLLTWEEVSEIFDWMVADLPNKTIGRLKRKARVELKRQKKWREQERQERATKRAAREAKGLPKLERYDDGYDSDVIPMTPEQETKFVNHNVENRTRELTDNMRLKRVRIAEDGINFIAAVNVLVTLKLITPDDFRQLIVEHLKMMPMMEEYYPLFDNPEAAFPLLNQDVFKETVEILQTMSSWGIFDPKAFVESLSSESPLEQRYALLREFFFCVGAFRRSRAVVEGYRQEMCYNMEQMSRCDDLRQRANLVGNGVIGRMEAALNKVWGLTPLIAPAVTEKIVSETINSLLTKERYPRVFEAMEALGKVDAYDAASFERAFDKNAPTITRYHLLQQIFLCAGAYNKSKNRMAEFDREFYRRAPPAPSWQIARSPSEKAPTQSGIGDRDYRMILELERDLRSYWQGIPCVRLNVVDLLLEDTLSSAHYVNIFRIVKDVRAGVQAQSPERDESEGGEESEDSRRAELRKNVRDGTVASFRALSAIFAAETLRTRGLSDDRRASYLLLTDGGFVDMPQSRNELALHRFDEYDEAKVSDLVVEQADRVTASLRMYRKECLGFITVGGKLHVSNWNPEKLQAIKDLMGLSSTVFHLQYMDDVLLLPASLTSAELKTFILMLARAGIISAENLQLQVAIPGRLSPENAAFLGSAVLLATEIGFRYSEKSFVTNQDESTGARIMLYDANGPVTRLPFVGELQGRTDMLARMCLGDVDLYQLVGTVLVHEQFGGQFKRFAGEFKKRYAAILREHGIDDVLRESWIYCLGDNRGDNEASKKHHKTVSKVTDAYFDCAEKTEQSGKAEGIIFEVRNLIEWLKQAVKIDQEKLYHDKSTCKDADLAVNF